MSGFDAARLERIGDHFDRYVEDGRLPGWLVRIARDGELVYQAMAGRRDLEADLPVEEDTLWRIYSMTKPITSVAAMMLWEEGRFELKDPVARFLPEFAEPRVFAGGAMANVQTRPAIEPIRMWHLLTHTSGLTYGFHHHGAVDALYREAGHEWGTPPGLDLAACCEQWAALPLLFQPGTRVELRRLDRRARPRGRGDRGPAARRVPRRPRARPARHDRHRASSRPRPTTAGSPRSTSPHPETGRATRSPASERPQQPPDMPLRRRRARLDRRRLRALHAHAAARRRARRRAPARPAHAAADDDATSSPAAPTSSAFGRPLFAETTFDGVGFGLGFSVVEDPVAARYTSSRGEFGWGGAASTAFWVDPVERLEVLFFTQLLPSSTYPIRSQLHQLVHQALDRLAPRGCGRAAARARRGP